MEVVAAAISGAQALAAAGGTAIDAGEALASIGDHFVATWSEELKRRRMPRDRREVLMRHGGRCATPGCTGSAEHDHHLEFRSRGGGDEKTNRVGLCAPCHLRGIHRGFLRVKGRAGERLTWRFGAARDGAPVETFRTEGDDDVRRAG